MSQKRAEPLRPAAKAKSSRLGRPGVRASLRRDEVVRLALTFMSTSEIAKRVGVTATHVSHILAEPQVQARIAAAKASAMNDTRALVQQYARRAVDRLAELMEHRNGAVAVRAAVEMMTKAGVDAAKRIDLGVVMGSTEDDLNAEWSKIRAELEVLERDPGRLTPEGEPSGGDTP